MPPYWRKKTKAEDVKFIKTTKIVIQNEQLKRIAKILKGYIKNNVDVVNYFCEGKMSPNEITVEVDEVGELSFPIPAECVEKLISISSKARFGMGTKTVLDTNVRDTYEIPSDKLTISINPRTFHDMMNTIRTKLGLSESNSLVPVLHNMLIYGPGQFFDLHQDSEKIPNMVATLVIILPSPHIGGTLTILHGKSTHTFVSEGISPKDAKCVAFYSDCKHKIEKIRDGYRVALTYKLALQGQASALQVNIDLEKAVKAYFSKTSIDDVFVEKNYIHYSQKRESNPLKLVYFLNHDYTEHSLGWHKLKGHDQPHASVLRAVAEKLDFIPHLVLVEVYESWYSLDENYNKKTFKVEYASGNVKLVFWINQDDTKVPYNHLDVGDEEMCWTKDTDSFEPHKTDPNLYTGNEGVSVDYVYKRAAVVLWPGSIHIPLNFKLNYKNALNDLSVLVDTVENKQKVMEKIEKAGKFLFHECNEDQKNSFDNLSKIALYIKNKDTALTILSHFNWSIVECGIADTLFKFQEEYGVMWCKSLLENWASFSEAKPSNFLFGSRSSGSGVSKVLSNMDNILKKMLMAKIETSILEFVLVEQITNITNDNQEYCTPAKLKENTPENILRVSKLISACEVLKSTSMLEKTIELVKSFSNVYPEVKLVDLYFQLRKNIDPDFLIHLEPFKAFLDHKLEESIALGTRNSNDWSIQEKLQHCSCEFCNQVNAFLLSKTETRKIIKTNKKVRKHIFQEFEGSELPVDVSETEEHWPKLVLVKKDILHKDYQDKLNKLEMCYAQLQTLKRKLET